MADQAENSLKTSALMKQSSTPLSAANSSLSDPSSSSSSSSSPPYSAAADYLLTPLPPRKKLSQETLSKNQNRRQIKKLKIKPESFLPKKCPPPPSADPLLEKRLRLLRRIAQFQAGVHPNLGPGDVELSLSSHDDGLRASMGVHLSVLNSRSLYFAEKLRDHAGGADSPILLSISDCVDVEEYVEVVTMMYCGDLRQRLVGEEVQKVLGLLEVSAEVKFNDGVAACLDYLEDVPWTKEEEEEVISIIRCLQLQGTVTKALQRVSAEPPPAKADSVFLQIMTGVIQAKDEKARQDMRHLLSGLLLGDTDPSTGDCTGLDVFRETLDHLCRQCLDSLQLCLSEAVSNNGNSLRDRGALMGKIAREAGNVQWLLEILTSKRMGDEFVMLWADQTELATLHSKIPGMYRYEISVITAQLCIALGKGQILAGKAARFSLLRTWLQALYDDFRWMKNSCRAYDKKMVEEALCQTILTLPMAQQQTILLRWLDIFLEKGGDCPNIQPAFEAWWRRAFVRPLVAN